MVIAYVLILLLGAVVLFSLEKLSVDLITLLLLIGLIVPGILMACPRKSGRFKSRVLGGRRKAERT